MSLVQHVSAVEGPDRVDLASLYDPPDNASIQFGRRLSLTLSYDPLPKGEVIDAPDGLGAYKVSTLRRAGRFRSAPAVSYPQMLTLRTAQVTAGVVICTLAAGIVFGFAALKQVLVQEGVYRDLCTAEELARDEPLCYLQDQKVTLRIKRPVFTKWLTPGQAELDLHNRISHHESIRLTGRGRS
jgi:hypothetical protein